jgi:hypothetical protein
LSIDKQTPYSLMLGQIRLLASCQTAIAELRNSLGHGLLKC